MRHRLFDLPRHSRRDVTPSDEAGVYALFLRPTSQLPLITPGPNGLIYIGKASGHRGFRARCHFVDKTVTHSPRKSLAVLLAEELALEFRGDGIRRWGLVPEAERRLTEWMLDSLLVAYFPSAHSIILEKEWVKDLMPPLNLNLCVQSQAHRKITQLRREANAAVNGAEKSLLDRRFLVQPIRKEQTAISAADVLMEGASEIAERYGIHPKQYRAELRKQHFIWHSYYARWSVPKHSLEWQEMIQVVERLSGRNLDEIK